MAHLYRHQILVTLAADGRLTAFRWRDATYHVTKVLSRWHERDRWWLPLASSAVAAPASPPTPPYVPPPKGPTDRHYSRLICDTGLLCEVYHDAATDCWVLDRVLD